MMAAESTPEVHASPARQPQPTIRRFPIGAEVQGNGVHFRVWAPRSKRVAVAVENGPLAFLEAEAEGYFSGFIPGIGAGSLYKLRLDNGDFPDPAARFQPQGPHGPSQVVDPIHFSWADSAWKGVPREGQVLYEMHVGTFTSEGTWRAAAERLNDLARLGITLVEVMPVAEFPGRFGWGYDGVDLFAPTHLFGGPDDFRAFVDQAHAVGLGVILDVVYNHLGPDGCYFREFSPDYFSSRYENEWGDPLNFDGENSGPVREFFITNAAYWIQEFHLDGLRFDATQQIFDASPEHILAAIASRTREAAEGRGIYLVAEHETQDVRLVATSADGGYALDSLWNDDFHHAAIVALSGHAEAYYSDYRGTPQEFISLIKYGYLYQGQRSRWQENPRGTPSLKLPPFHFVNFLQNHDQVANSLDGRRLHELTAPGVLRAMTALLLLGPNTPMLFQGQEFAASAPFLYFADHHRELAAQVAAGRRKFLGQFPSIASAISANPNVVADPGSEATFHKCKLDHAERDTHSQIYRLHADLLALRRSDAVFNKSRRQGVDGAVLGTQAFVLRFFGENDDDRLLIINFGVAIHLDPAPEPLLAPIASQEWKIIWSSEDLAYGGGAVGSIDPEENWRLPGQAAVVLAPSSPCKSSTRDHG